MEWFLFILSVLLPFPLCFIRSKDGRIDPFQPGVAIFVLYELFINLSAGYDLIANDTTSHWVRYKTSDPHSAYIYGLFLCISCLVAFGFGYKYLLGSKLKRLPIDHRVGIKLRRNSWVWLVVAGLIGAGSLYARSASARLLAHKHSVVQVGPLDSIYQTLIQLLVWAVLTAWMLRIGKKFSFPTLAVTAVAFMALVIFSGKRTDVLPFLVIPTILWHYSAGFLKRNVLVFFGATVMVVATLLLGARILVPILLGGGSQGKTATNLIFSAPFTFLLKTPEYSAFDMVVLGMENQTSMIDQLGGPLQAFTTQNIEPLTAPVPRALWPDKPDYTDMSEFFFRDSTSGLRAKDNDETGFAATGIGVLYVMGGDELVGFIVAVLGSFFVGWGARAVYNRFIKTTSIYSTVAYAAFVWYLFHACRYGGLGYTTIDFLYKSVFGIWMLFSLTTEDPDAPRIMRPDLPPPRFTVQEVRRSLGGARSRA